MSEEYFTDYLRKVVYLADAKIYPSKSQLLIETRGLKIRINYPHTPHTHLAFKVKRQDEHYYRPVVLLKKEEPSNWFSNTVRFVIQSIILNEQYQKSTGELNKFTFAKNYKSILNEQ